MNGTQSSADQVVSAAVGALIDDAIAAVRSNPDYANAVNQLADQALRAVLSGL